MGLPKEGIIGGVSTYCLGLARAGKVHAIHQSRLQPGEPVPPPGGGISLGWDQPAILLGHSIGGMITLTFCRLFPKALGDRVRAIALVQTTYTNPVRTANMAGLLTALERPVIVPLLHLTIWLSPLIWLSNLMSYLNGSALLSTKSSGFAGKQTPAPGYSLGATNASGTC